MTAGELIESGRDMRGRARAQLPSQVALWLRWGGIVERFGRALAATQEERRVHVVPRPGNSQVAR